LSRNIETQRPPDKGGQVALRRLALMDHGMHDGQIVRSHPELWKGANRRRHDPAAQPGPIKRLRDCEGRFDDIDRRMDKLERTLEQDVRSRLETIIKMMEHTRLPPHK
jgi:hypothetical protein